MFHKETKNANPKAETQTKEKPVLEVISPNLKKEVTVNLENVKEKSLDSEESPRQILSTHSIKKLKEKIIGKIEKDIEAKGNLKSHIIFFISANMHLNYEWKLHMLVSTAYKNMVLFAISAVSETF